MPVRHHAERVVLSVPPVIPAIGRSPRSARLTGADAEANERVVFATAALAIETEASDGVRPAESAEIRPPQPSLAAVAGGVPLTLSDAGAGPGAPAPGSTASGVDAGTPAGAGGPSGALTFQPMVALSLFSGSLLALTSRGRESTPAGGNVTFKVVDGYVSGAQIYVDVNRNGRADPEEIARGVTTNDRGEFTLAAVPAAPVIAVGGTNTDTGLPNSIPILAPAGATVLSPLTTLAQALILESKASSASEASGLVMRSLGLSLPEGATLLDYDPIARDDVALQRAGAGVATLISLAGSNRSVLGQLALQNLTQLLVDESAGNRQVDLFSDETVRSVMGDLVATDLQDAAAAAMSSLKSAGTMHSLASSQRQALTVAPPATPEIDIPAVCTVANPPGAVVLSSAGSPGERAALAGDTLEIVLFRGAQRLAAHTAVLSAEDIARGRVDIESPSELGDGAYRLTASILGRRGESSAVVEAPFAIDADAARAISVSLEAGGVPLGVNLTQGTSITATVTVDAPVVVVGSPVFAMHVGPNSVLAHYEAEKSTTTSLVFSHVLERSAEGWRTSADALDLAGGSIVDGSGRPAVLIVPPAHPSGFVFTTGGSTVDPDHAYSLGSVGGDGRSFRVALAGQPSSDVTLTLESADGTEAALRDMRSPPSPVAPRITLHFTPGNWDTAQEFDVVLVDDRLNDSPVSIPVFAGSHSQDPLYDGLGVGGGPAGSLFGVTGLPMAQTSLVLKLQGTDFAAGTDTVSLAPIGDSAASPANLSVALSRAPIDTVWLTVIGDSDDFTVQGASPGIARQFEFTPQDWDRARTLSLGPARVPGLSTDNVDNLVLTAHSADPNFDGLSATIRVDAPDIVSADPGEPDPLWGGAPGVVLDLIRTGIHRLIDQLASQSLPLIGQMGEPFMDALADSLWPPADIDFVFDQSDNTLSLSIEKQLPGLSMPLASDLGFDVGDPSAPIIAFDLDAQVNLDANLRLLLSGQVDTAALLRGDLADALVLRPFDPGPSDADGDDFGTQLRLDLSASVPGGISGTIGPLTVTATDPVGVNPALMRDMGTGFRGRVDVSLVDNTPETPGVSAGDLVNHPDGTVDLRAGWRGQVSASVEARLETGFDAMNFFLPSVSFDLGIPFASGVVSDDADRRQALLIERREFLLESVPGLSNPVSSGNLLPPFTNPANGDALELAWLNAEIARLQSQPLHSGGPSTNVDEVLLDDIVLDLGGVFDYVRPVLEVVDPVLQAVRPLVDFFRQDLLPKLELTAFEIQTPWYEYLIPGWGWRTYAVDELKEFLSAQSVSLVRELVNSFDGSIDNAPDGRVNLLELMHGAVKAAQGHAEKKAADAQAAFDSVGWMLNDRLPVAIGPDPVGSLESVETVIEWVNRVAEYLELYYSVSERLRAPNGLIGLDQGINLGSLVIAPATDPSVAAQVPGTIPDAAPRAEPPHWIAVPPEGQSARLSPYDLLQSREIPEATPLIEDLARLGVRFPLLTDDSLLGKILMLQPVGLVEFRPLIPTLRTDIEVPLFDVIDLLIDSALPGLSSTLDALRKMQPPGGEPLKFEAPVSLRAGFALDSALAVGIDTAGVLEWVRNGMRSDRAGAASLLNGLYLSDNVAGGVDAPEFSGQYGLSLGLHALFGGEFYGLLLNADAGLGIHGNFEIDLQDGGEEGGLSDGKIRPSELIAAMSGSGNDSPPTVATVLAALLPGGPLYDVELDGSGTVGVGAGLIVDLASAGYRPDMKKLDKLFAFLPDALWNFIKGHGIDVIPKIEIDLEASRTFPIFDTREGQPVLFA